MTLPENEEDTGEGWAAFFTAADTAEVDDDEFLREEMECGFGEDV